jgi:L-iditol 2-dehydrogenase
MKMKAIVMYKPRDLRIEQVDIPGIEDEEVLLKVMAVGICGSDIPRINVYGGYISPIIPGHEFAGEITKVGKDVKGFKEGDHVTVPPLIPCYRCKYCNMGEYSLCKDYSYYGSRRNGAFAQYIAVKGSNLLKIADNVSFECAATTDPLANALHGLKQAKFNRGDAVCVYGVGAIGQYMLQAAKAMGAGKIAAVDISDEKLKTAEESGADITFNGLEKDVAVKVADYFGEGADVVADVTGSPAAQLNAILSAAKLGRVVIIGISHKGLELTEKAVDNLMRGQISIIGSWNSFSEPFPGWEWTEAIKMMAEGKVNCEYVISHRLPLDEAPAVFEKIYKGGFFYNKIIFLPWK